MQPVIDRCIPWRVPWYMWLAAAVAVLAGIHLKAPQLLHGETLLMVVPGVVLVLLVAAIMWELPPAAMVCGALALTLFSGNWTTLGFPGFPFVPDRILLVAALLALILKSPGAVDLPRVRVRGVHLLMLFTVLYAIASGVLADTMATKATVFDLLDRLGAIPFLMFLVSPAIFSGPRERGWLLATLVAIGAYLGFTAIFESLGPHSLVFPHYIRELDLARGSAAATGPFSEVVTEGFACYACAVAAVIASVRWRGGWRWVAIVVAVVCLFGSFLTYERGVWIGAAAGAVVAGLLAREARRWLLAGVPLCALAVVGVLALVPSINSTASSRLNSIYPVWDRQNQTVAALNMIQTKPLLGFGFDNWANTATPYFRLGPNRLLTGFPSSTRNPYASGSSSSAATSGGSGGAGSGSNGASGGAGSGSVGQVEGALHDTYLTYAVELGLVGATLWIVSVLWGLGSAVFNRDRDPDLRPWRLGLVAVGVCFLVLCAVDPLLPNFTPLILWTWAGVAAGGAGVAIPAARRLPRPVARPKPTAAFTRTGRLTHT
ncbi:MAG TPA: O-antigen ligase family protein [Solirubrobacteraceae bacterium]|nr:O-antigen ligase family protein [Solirubrobacteraceae bacterium]